MGVPGKWIDRAGQRRSLDRLILDLSSSLSETYGRRERHRHQRRRESPSDGCCCSLLSHFVALTSNSYNSFFELRFRIRVIRAWRNPACVSMSAKSRSTGTTTS